MKQLSRLFIISIVIISTISIGLAQDETEPQVSLTIYNEGSALVRDIRVFDVGTGIQTLDFTDVASGIDTTSVSLVSVTNPDGVRVLEQNYVYDLVDGDALLRKYIDEEIEVTLDDATNSVVSGTLLAADGGQIILQTADGRVMTLRRVQNVSFPSLPDGLITRPTLRWLLRNDGDASQQLELTYLTNGVSWEADYILLLGEGNESLDLNGWVTLNNFSGASYNNAQLKLVAGDLNRVDPGAFREELEFAADAPAEASFDDGVAQREFFEYQLYEVNRPVTVGNNEQKQIEFVTGTDVEATSFFVYDSSEFVFNWGYPVEDDFYGETGVTNVQNWLEFTTGPESGLDADLPAGRVRVYQEDVDGAALLVGEDTIDHTPNGENVRLYLGNAFDLVGERTRTNFELTSRRSMEETFEIRLRNRKDDETVEIRVPERLFRWINWEILEASHDYTQVDSSSIEFRIEVPPGEEVVLTYTVRYSWTL